MKVKELIEHLREFDPELDVVEHDNEWGYFPQGTPTEHRNIEVEFGSPFDQSDKRVLERCVVL